MRAEWVEKPNAVRPLMAVMEPQCCEPGNQYELAAIVVNASGHVPPPDIGMLKGDINMAWRPKDESLGGSSGRSCVLSFQEPLPGSGENIRWKFAPTGVKALVDKVNRHDLWLESARNGLTTFRNRRHATQTVSNASFDPTIRPPHLEPCDQEDRLLENEGRKSMTATARKIAMFPKQWHTRGEALLLSRRGQNPHLVPSCNAFLQSAKKSCRR